MKNTAEMLSTAIRIATAAHDGQYDKGGKPYILHPMFVMNAVREYGFEVMAIAILHDTVEDCGITYAYLRKEGLSERIVEGVRCMTKVPGEDDDQYRDKVASNIDAIHVKMADLRHNSDMRRLKGITDKDVKRAEKYMKLYHYFQGVLESRRG